MTHLTRRRWLSGAAGSVPLVWSSRIYGRRPLAGCRVGAFRVDVTPPLGHPLLGGNFRPAEKIGDPLYAHGLVFTGADERPIVFVALDWCELRNQAYQVWRESLAAAAKTTPDRVLVHCVHQHDAPYVDLGAQQLLAEAGVTARMCDPAFHDQAVRKVVAAVQPALDDAAPLTHIGRSRAVVERVASNRRVLKPDGTPHFGRYSQCRDPLLREQPPGEIDPHLTSLTFYSGEKAVAALQAFAVHPMSPYGKGIVSADFIGEARARRQRDMPDTMQLYGSGCCGDVTAGKYNDGSPDVRAQLAERLYAAMVRAVKNEERHAVERVTVRSSSLVLPYWDVPELRSEGLRQTLNDVAKPLMPRAMAALGLNSLLCHPDGHHVDLQAIDFGAAQVALFPAESFVSFQLQVQAALADKFILPLGFGECAPGYMPTQAAVREGFREEHGYCWVDASAERRVVDGMTALLK